MTPDSAEQAGTPGDDEGPVGPFPSWNAVYGAVVAVTLIMIVLLYWFTVALDFSG